MTPEQRSIIMRSNRLLGANLVEQNLVKIEDLDNANERLLEVMGQGELRRISVLAILANELKVVKEDDILAKLIEDESIGLIDLSQYDLNQDLKKKWDINNCWATWTVPFDQEDGITLFATAYYYSSAVRTFWEKLLPGPSIWYATTLDNIADCLEKNKA
jgi:hypothetical protein